MSEEEKEAIEILKRVNKANRFDGLYSSVGIIFEAQKTILNLIDKLQKDNYELDRENQLIFEKNIELQKENEQYEEIKNLISKEELFDIDYIKEFFIDKDKIRDKIIELEKEMKRSKELGEFIALKEKVSVLRELL